MEEKIAINLGAREASGLIKMLENQNIEFSTSEDGGGFLPSPWKEIIVVLSPVLLNILYDFLKTRKSKSKIVIKTDDTSMELNADSIQKLELRLKKKHKRKTIQNSKG